MSKKTVLLLTLSIFLILSVTVLASFQPVYKPSLKIIKTEKSIKIDGIVNTEEWGNATKALNFVERSPGDNSQPEVYTEAFMTYDDEFIYIAFKCHDDPAKIRATMCQRDQFQNDDAVCFLVDPYGDATWAYEFFVNPYGIQKDKLWTSTVGEDSGFDMIWQSAAKITSDGYEVEMAIPFSSIRFPNNDKQAWKVDFWRNRPRESYYQYSWAANDRDEQCFPCKWGTVEGIQDVSPGKGIEILPSVIALQSGNISNYSDVTSGFNNADPDGEFALNGKYAINSNITVEAAYNPDFSQIEADADQIDINSTIALFYPERRPYFQEGADIFRTLFNSFYTRTINDPQITAKLTSRMNRTSIGFLTARDENSPYLIPLTQSSALYNVGKSTTNILRGKQGFGNNSMIGFIVTDRRLENDGSSTVLSTDGSFRFSSKIRLDWQLIASHVAEPNDTAMTSGLNDVSYNGTEHTIGFDGESYWGHAFISVLRYSSRNLGMRLDVNETGKTYQTQNGFDPVNNYRRYNNSVWYTIRPENGIVESYTPSLGSFLSYDLDGNLLNEHYEANFQGRLKTAQTYFSFNVSKNSVLYSDVQFDDLFDYRFNIGSRFNDKVGFNFNIRYGEQLARRFLTTGNELSVGLSLNLKPTDRLLIAPNFDYLKSNEVDTDVELYEGYIARNRINYQLTKNLSLRFITQYNNFSDQWDFDPLITYRLSSFSVFYIGSAYDYNRLTNINDSDQQWRMTNRQFFLKLQYLFQT